MWKMFFYLTLGMTIAGVIKLWGYLCAAIWGTPMIYILLIMMLTLEIGWGANNVATMYKVNEGHIDKSQLIMSFVPPTIANIFLVILFLVGMWEGWGQWR